MCVCVCVGGGGGGGGYTVDRFGINMILERFLKFVYFAQYEDLKAGVDKNNSESFVLAFYRLQ